MTTDSAIPPYKLTANVKAGGCAAKIGAVDLQTIMASALSKLPSPNLLIGPDNFDDAAVYKISDNLAVIQTVDFFPPMTDDPYLFGQIAATNSLSDIYAMGAEPIFALNVLCFPTCDFPLAAASEILKGGASQVEAAGAVVAGGHSIQSAEVIYGMTVTAIADPATILTNSGAKEADHLILTKPIGSGVALLGHKGGVLSQAASNVLFTNLTQLNRQALTIVKRFPLHAATDVTGFGLIGHIHEMAKAAGLSFSLRADRVPFLPEVLPLARQGFVPAGAYVNRQSYTGFTSVLSSVELAIMDLCFDPQTAGGLLVASPKEGCEKILAHLQAEGLTGACLGQFQLGEPGMIEITLDERASQ